MKFENILIELKALNETTISNFIRHAKDKNHNIYNVSKITDDSRTRVLNRDEVERVLNSHEEEIDSTVIQKIKKEVLSNLPDSKDISTEAKIQKAVNDIKNQFKNVAWTRDPYLWPREARIKIKKLATELNIDDDTIIQKIKFA